MFDLGLTSSYTAYSLKLHICYIMPDPVKPMEKETNIIHIHTYIHVHIYIIYPKIKILTTW